jgi:hypothetical protein
VQRRPLIRRVSFANQSRQHSLRFILPALRETEVREFQQWLLLHSACRISLQVLFNQIEQTMLLVKLERLRAQRPIRRISLQQRANPLLGGFSGSSLCTSNCDRSKTRSTLPGLLLQELIKLRGTPLPGDPTAPTPWRALVDSPHSGAPMRQSSPATPPVARALPVRS